MENKTDLLKAVFCLDHNIKVYLPSTQDIDKKADSDIVQGLLDDGLELLSVLFGGATQHQAIGAWYSQVLHKTVTEPVTILEAYATKEAIEEGLQTVIDYCEKIKDTLAQEAVSLEYDNRLYFI